jgi:hypothetical protein
MGPMVPMGFELDLSPAQQWVLLGILVGLAVCLATPASMALAAVGSSRAVAHPGWNGLWYWCWGTALTVGAMYGLFHAGLRWWAIPVGWIPGLAAAWVLRVRRPRGELRWTE